MQDLKGFREGDRVFNCFSGRVSEGPCFGSLKSFALTMVIFSPFHEYLLRFLHTCYSGGECSYPVLCFENFLLCILELGFMVGEKRCKFVHFFLHFCFWP